MVSTTADRTQLDAQSPILPRSMTESEVESETAGDNFHNHTGEERTSCNGHGPGPPTTSEREDSGGTPPVDMALALSFS